MFPMSPTLIAYAAVAALVVGLGVAVKVQTSRLDAAKTEYATFKAEVKATGEAAQKLADAQKAADKVKKENTDAKHKRAVADLSADLARLRDERANSHLLPPAAPNSRSPEIAAFDRPLLERALSGFVEGTANLIAEGSAATVDLNAAKEWAK